LKTEKSKRKQDLEEAEGVAEKLWKAGEDRVFGANGLGESQPLNSLIHIYNYQIEYNDYEQE